MTMEIELFATAGSETIPVGVDLVQTAGYSVLGVGPARYIFDAAVDAPYVAAHPRTAFLSSNGQGFRLLAGGFVVIEQLGAEAGVASDQATIINAALELDGAQSVLCGEGTYWTDQTVVVPSGKRFIGQGKSRTIIKALPTFDKDVTTNAIVASGTDAISVFMSDMTVDANRVGLGLGLNARINGVVMGNGAKDFRIERVDALNCTGYAHYVAGASGLSNPPGGSYSDCCTFNSEVHFEPQSADGVIYSNCHARDGEGDIGCASWFHPIAGSRNIVWQLCTGKGSAGVGMDPTPNEANLENISFLYGRVENDAAVALRLIGNYFDTIGLDLSGSTFISTSGVGAIFDNAMGRAVGATFHGQVEGIQVNHSELEFVGCDIRGETNPAGAQASYGVIGNSGHTWLRGGKVEALGPTGLMFPVVGTVGMDPGVRLVPPLIAQVIRQEVRGQRPIIGDGANSYTNISIPRSFANIDKVQLSLSIMNSVDAIAPAYSLSWKFVDNQTIRVRIGGANLSSGYELTYHFAEWE